jgi:hypothetical protein
MARTFQTRFRRVLRTVGLRAEPQNVTVSDQTGEGGRTQSIPLVVYQTAETSSAHPMHFKSLSEFRALNKDLSFALFDRDSRDLYMREVCEGHPIYDIYQRAVFGQMRVDIFRYCIVWERGGYWFDFNKGCSTPLSSLHAADAEGIVSYESNPEVLFPEGELASRIGNPFNLAMQWAFGFQPRHEVLLRAVDRIVEIEPHFRGKTFHNPKTALLTMTATGLFTSVFREYVREKGLGSICEAGIDFHGSGIFRLRGSKIELNKGTHYSREVDKEIARDVNPSREVPPKKGMTNVR